MARLTVLFLGYALMSCSSGGGGGGGSGGAVAGSGGTSDGGTSGTGGASATGGAGGASAKKGVGELCNESTECQLGLTCPEGKCQAKCTSDDECKAIDPAYVCDAGSCVVANPWTCDTEYGIPGYCTCGTGLIPYGTQVESCVGYDACCGVHTLETGYQECNCVEQWVLEAQGNTCDAWLQAWPPQTATATCPP
jgi:hypothetical protein